MKHFLFLNKRWLALPAALATGLVALTGCSTDDQDKDGITAAAGDCDDNDLTVYPGAPELCDDKDNDCNSLADDLNYYYRDEDGDGFGNPTLEQPDCTKPSGYVEQSGDCDDRDPNTRPGAEETCDGEDNNCDSIADENLDIQTWYWDEDADGYGVEEQTVEGCAPPVGYAPLAEDCDDINPNIHPGEKEECDAVDNDCDGKVDEGDILTLMWPDADQDHYGDSDIDPELICAVAPGYSPVAGDCDDTNDEIFPTAPERCNGFDDNCNETIDEELRFRYFVDNDGDGFGGEEVQTCNPTASQVRGRGDCDDDDPSVHPGSTDPLGDNKDSDCGGSDFPEPHVLLSGTSSPLIKPALLAAEDGDTVWVGPGIFIDGDLTCGGHHIKLMSTHLADETVIDAGELSRVFFFSAGEDSGCVVDGFTITNGLKTEGGGIYINNASPTLRYNRILSNSATNGAGIYINNSSATITRNTIQSNTASDMGGGIFVAGGEPRISNNLILANRTKDEGGRSYGGGVAVIGGSPVLLNNTVVGNAATFGGGISVEGEDSAPTIQNSIIAYNLLDNLYSDGKGDTLVAYTNLYNKGFGNHNLKSVASSNKVLEPGFVYYYPSYDLNLADLHLTPTSSLRNAGNPAIEDPDGTVSDLGAYGGTSADLVWYDDSDEDGMYDAWESRFGFLVGVQDADADGDADGLSNGDELSAGTDPSLPDGDGDGSKDGAEVAAGSDPWAWVSRPGAPEGMAIRVPGDFDTFAEAIRMMTWGGTIDLTSGAYDEALNVERVALTLNPASDAAVTQLTSSIGSIVHVTYSVLNAQGLQLVNARTSDGAAIHAVASQLNLTDVHFEGNQAQAEGGAIRAVASRGTLTRCRFVDNQAELGSALFAWASQLELEETILEDNTALTSGALYVDGGSDVSASGLEIRGNIAQSAPAAHVVSSTLTLVDSTIEDNELIEDTMDGGALVANVNAVIFLEDSVVRGHRANNGAGILADYATIVATRSEFSNNVAASNGGAVYLTNYATATMTNSAFFDNRSSNKGGAMATTFSVAELDNCVLANNSALRAGAILQADDVYWSSGFLTLRNTALINNNPDNLVVYLDSSNNTNPLVDAKYSAFWMDGGDDGTNLVKIEETNVVADPLFVTFDAANHLYDMHLQAGSPLIDTGDPAILDKDGSRSDIGLYGGPEAL